MEIKLAEIRNKKNISLRQLSIRTEIDRTTLNKIENSKKSPTIHQLEKIAAALNCKIGDIIKSEYL